MIVLLNNHAAAKRDYLQHTKTTQFFALSINFRGFNYDELDSNLLVQFGSSLDLYSWIKNQNVRNPFTGCESKLLS